MNRFKFKYLALVSSLVGAMGLSLPVAYASEGGSCHFHGSKLAPEATVIACATQRKVALIEQGKLASSWNQATHAIEMVEGKKGKEWKVAFKNVAIKEPAKQTLYMFFTPPGNFIAANFTGQ